MRYLFTDRLVISHSYPHVTSADSNVCGRSSLTESQSTLTWQTQPSPQTVDVGSSVSFTCLAQYSTKTYFYKWERNNFTLPRDRRFTTKDEGRTLQISQTRLEDRGHYQCVAISVYNGVVGKSQYAALNIRGICNSVQLSIQPPGNTFLTGTDLQLLCKCHIYPLGTYTWTKNGVPVVQDGRVTVSQNKLLINNATEGDSGKYVCKATTKDESTTKSSFSFRAVVGKQPQFLVRPPAEVVFLKGSQTLIPCKAVGSPVPVINWYTTYASYYGRVHWSRLRANAQYTIHENGSLVIRKINKQGTLKYKCVAYNLFARIGAETMVKIAYLDDVVLRRTKLYVLHNHETEKNRTKLSDSGKYTCTAKNIFGTKTSNVEIIVSERPVITVKPQDQELKKDERAMLNCKADSIPPSKISWNKDYWWEPIKGDARVFVLSNGSLVITKLKPEDSGVYRCSADHDGGWPWFDRAEAKLTVIDF
ncbi:hypothetical protein ACROYT_G039406 [Oculina patagonica]